jgi:two-component system, cell cycle sensor histidine kinase and response regulator CckA
MTRHWSQHQPRTRGDDAALDKHVVMVVDDDDAVRRVTMRALETFGFTTVGAASGFEAVETFKNDHHGLHCVIVDMNMPGMNGKQTMQSFREIDASVPVLLASGHSADEMREAHGDAGFAGYLQKPFQIALLAASVKRVIESNDSRTRG